MTHSLGERVGAEGEEPERWRWTDDGGVSVTLELRAGKLTAWALARPQAGDGSGEPGVAAAATDDGAPSSR